MRSRFLPKIIPSNDLPCCGNLRGSAKLLFLFFFFTGMTWRFTIVCGFSRRPRVKKGERKSFCRIGKIEKSRQLPLRGHCGVDDGQKWPRACCRVIPPVDVALCIKFCQMDIVLFFCCCCCLVGGNSQAKRTCI